MGKSNSKKKQHKKQVERQKRAAEVIKAQKLEQEKAEKAELRAKRRPILIRRTAAVLLSAVILGAGSYIAYERHWSQRHSSERVVFELRELKGDSIMEDALVYNLSSNLQYETNSNLEVTAYRGRAAGENKTLAPYLIRIVPTDDQDPEESVTSTQLVFSDQIGDFVQEDQESLMSRSDRMIQLTEKLVTEFINGLGVTGTVYQIHKSDNGLILMLANDTSSMSEFSLVLDQNPNLSFRECVKMFQKNYKFEELKITKPTEKGVDPA